MSFITFGLVKEKYVVFVCKLNVLCSTLLLVLDRFSTVVFIVRRGWVAYFCFWFSVKGVKQSEMRYYFFVIVEDASYWSGIFNASGVSFSKLPWKLVSSSCKLVFFTSAYVE